MRTRLIVANWKMNFTVPEALKFVAQFQHDMKAIPPAVEVVLAPPFTALFPVLEILSETEITVAAQNMHWEGEGAFTGEIAASFLQELGVPYVILGHSERRQHFGETDAMIQKKIAAAFEHKLIPIFCVGETESERESGKTFSVLERQISAGISGLSKNNLAALVIAYEPVWAIGTGKTAKPSDVQEALRFLREQVREEKIRLLYGGSVNPEKAKALASQPEVDGFLVGSASLQPDSFANIVRTMVWGSSGGEN